MTDILEATLEHARVRLTVSSASGTLLTVTRRHPSGRVIAVRGMDLVPLSGGTFVGWDYELPISVPVTYVASVYGPSDTDTPLDSSDGVTVTWTTPHDWLKDPLEPIRNMPILVGDIGDFTYDSRMGVHPVIGRPNPVTIGDTRSSANGEFTFVTLSQDFRDRFHLITSSGHPLLLQSTQESGVGNLYFAPLSVREARYVPLRDSIERGWTVSYQEVDMPVGAASAFTTWQDVLNQYPDWQAVRDSANTWTEFISNLGSSTQPPTIAWRGA
jgi:hypothetical protein